MELIGRCYIAGPFFNDADVAIIREVEDNLSRLGIKFVSPRLETTAPAENLSPYDKKEIWEQIFAINVENVEDCDWMLSTSVSDQGTIFEAGTAFAFGKPILGFLPTPINKLNLMLVCGYNAIACGWDELENALELGEIADNQWEGEIE